MRVESIGYCKKHKNPPTYSGFWNLSEMAELSESPELLESTMANLEKWARAVREQLGDPNEPRLT